MLIVLFYNPLTGPYSLLMKLIGLKITNQRCSIYVVCVYVCVRACVCVDLFITFVNVVANGYSSSRPSVHIPYSTSCY